MNMCKDSKILATFKNIHLGYICIDSSANIVFFNDRFKKFTGFRKSDLAGQPIFPLISKKIASEFQQVLTEIRQYKQHQLITLEFIKNSSQRILTQASCLPEMDENQEVTFIHIVITDISEKIQYINELEKSKKAWQDSVDALQDVMILIDRDYRIEKINEYGRKLVNLPFSHIIGQKCHRILFNRDKRCDHCQHPQFEKGTTALQSSYFLKTFNRSFSIITSPIKDKNGNITKFVDLWRDITKIQNLEDQLKETENLFYTFLNRLPAVAFITTPDGKVIFLNNFAKKHFTEFHWIGDEDTAKIPDSWKPVIETQNQDVIANKTIDIFSDVKDNNNEIVNIHIHKFLLPESNQGTLIGGIAVDITEMKKVQQAIMEAKEEAEAASAAKSDFIANMSHELRTPMNGIMGASQILKATNIDEEQSSYLSILDISAQNLLAIINDLLNYSRIHSGKVQVKNQVFNLKELAEQIVGTMKPLADTKKLTLELKFNSQTDDIFSDKDLIKKIVETLLSNGIKFTDSGSVTLEITVDSVLIIKVIDTGIGLSDDDKEKIFNTFTQLENTYTKSRQGIGLGLSICKNFIDKLAGNIQVTSQLGKGSVFKVQIPLDEKPVIQIRTEKQIPQQKPEEREAASILIADDDNINSLWLKVFLNKQGIDCQIGKNGKEVLELLDQHQFNLILMDINMPVMNGLEATKQIRKLSAPYSSVPIIALTAYTSDEDRNNAFDAGVDDFIPKPVEEKTLLETISNFI